MPAKQKILVADPDPDFLDWARSQLAADDIEVVTAETSEDAFRLFSAQTPIVTITEMRLGTHSGLELLARLRKRDPNALVIITGALGTTQSVIESMRLGAFDFVRKEQLPFNLKIVVDAAIKAAAEMQRAQKFEPSLTVEQHQDSIVGQSPAMQEVFKMVGRISNSDAAVMITGESGSGKELVARAIHQYSARHDRPFLAINCAAIPENLLESELFGHEKGAFTDAHDTRSGKFELASGGTLFLDEIGDMSLGGQAKLLRVLEEKVVVRVGGSTAIPVNVRVIAATNQNLVDLVRQKKFREDLYFRLTVVTLNLPPLRHRADDVLQLADFFLTTFCAKIGRSKPTLNASAKKRLTSHPWPGNVRELRNIIERIAYLTTDEVIEDSEIDFVRSPRADGESDSERIDLSKPLAQATDDFQARYIEQQLKACKRNMTLAAERMGMQRSNLYRKMKQLGMNHHEPESSGNS